MWDLFLQGEKDSELKPGTKFCYVYRKSPFLREVWWVKIKAK